HVFGGTEDDRFSGCEIIGLDFVHAREVAAEIGDVRVADVGDGHGIVGVLQAHGSGTAPPRVRTVGSRTDDGDRTPALVGAPLGAQPALRLEAGVVFLAAVPVRERGRAEARLPAR